MIRRRPGATRTDSLCPYTTRFRSVAAEHLVVELAAARRAGVDRVGGRLQHPLAGVGDDEVVALAAVEHRDGRSEEHTSDLQSLMRISYAVFCLKNTTHNLTN